ncbi:MAG: Transcriptional regulator, AsnC family, partial [uncultured Nocardioidaceae bacterium]
GRPRRGSHQALRRRAPDRRPRGVPPAGGGSRHRAVPARQARPAWRHRRLGADAGPRGAGLPGDRLPDPGDPAGGRPRRGGRTAQHDPGGPRGVHDHRRGRHVVPRRGPVQRRPAAGDRRGARRRRGAALDHRHCAGHPDPAPGAAAARGGQAL